MTHSKTSFGYYHANSPMIDPDAGLGGRRVGELQASAAQLEVLTLLTRRCDYPGNSAVTGLRAVRPEVFAPPTFGGFAFFVTPGDGSTTLHSVHAACQQSNILILLKVTA
jgi:hypothetical protein